MVDAPADARRVACGDRVTSCGATSRGPAPEIAESARKSEPRTWSNPTGTLTVPTTACVSSRRRSRALAAA